MKEKSGGALALPIRMFVEAELPDKTVPERTGLRVFCGRKGEKPWYCGTLTLYPDLAIEFLAVLDKWTDLDCEIIKDDEVV